MRTIVLLFLVAMAAIYATVLLVQPKALQKGTPTQASTADISHPSNPAGSASFVTEPHIKPDAKAAAAK
jgi:hypothetical protein